MTSQDVTKWVIVAVLLFVALVTFVLARQVISPLDGFLTQQVCSSHGAELGRPTTGYEREGRFPLRNRTEGTCFYGPPDEEGGAQVAAVEEAGAAVAEPDTLAIALADTEPSALYRYASWMALFLQLGAASAVVRLLADPLLDRFGRRPG